MQQHTRCSGDVPRAQDAGGSENALGVLGGDPVLKNHCCFREGCPQRPRLWPILPGTLVVRWGGPRPHTHRIRKAEEEQESPGRSTVAEGQTLPREQNVRFGGGRSLSHQTAQIQLSVAAGRVRSRCRRPATAHTAPPALRPESPFAKSPTGMGRGAEHTGLLSALRGLTAHATSLPAGSGPLLHRRKREPRCPSEVCTPGAPGPHRHPR